MQTFERMFGNEDLLRTALKGTVPMWYLDLYSKGEEYWMRRKGVCAQTVAEKGDVLMYGSKRAGAAAEVFNRLAEGCALLMLITKHPFEIFDLRFLPDGKIEDMRDMRQADQRALQSEEVPSVREEFTEATTKQHDQGADPTSQGPDRENG